MPLSPEKWKHAKLRKLRLWLVVPAAVPAETLTLPMAQVVGPEGLTQYHESAELGKAQEQIRKSIRLDRF